MAIIALVEIFRLHLYACRHYGYFVDELYYLACAQHLDWGYVDPPPLIAVVTKFIRLTGGDSLPAIHLLPTLAGAGNRPQKALPETIFAAEYAPYSKLLPRAAMVVHQGGVGTTAQCLRAGKPMLIMPYSHDQPDNARRMLRLKVARVIQRGNYTPITGGAQAEGDAGGAAVCAARGAGGAAAGAGRRRAVGVRCAGGALPEHAVGNLYCGRVNMCAPRSLRRGGRDLGHPNLHHRHSTITRSGC